MKLPWTILILVVIWPASSIQAQEVEHRLIVGWDDVVVCCGPGTDAGMDSPAAVERMVKRWKARGYKGIRDGRWHHGSSQKIVDTKIPAAFDAWHHLQWIVEPSTKTYRILVQVIGEPPRELCSGSLLEIPPPNTPMAFELTCLRQQPRTDGPAFDNLIIHR